MILWRNVGSSGTEKVSTSPSGQRVRRSFFSANHLATAFLLSLVFCVALPVCAKDVAENVPAPFPPIESSRTVTVMRPEPKDRVAYISTMCAPYTQDRKYKLTPEEEKLCVPVSGTVLDDAGTPVSGATVRIYESMRYWSLDLKTAADGTFSGKVWPGPHTVIAWAPTQPMTRVNFDKGIPDGKCTIKLPKSHVFRFQCIDDKDKPVEGAVLTLKGEEHTYYSVNATTGKDGWATFPHVTEGSTLDLTVHSSGHLSFKAGGIAIKGNDPGVPIRLTVARPYLLKIKEQGTGKPLKDVHMYIYETDPSAGYIRPEWNEDTCKTDEKGEVQLLSLEPGRLYTISAASDTHSAHVPIRLNDAMSSEAEIPLRCTVKLILSNVPPQPDKKLSVTWFEMTGTGGSGRSEELDIKDGRVELVHAFRRGSSAQYRFLNQEHQTETLTTDNQTVELDCKLSEPTEKPTTVIVKLRAPEGEAPPAGELNIQWEKDKKQLKKGEARNGHLKPVLKDGETSFEVPRGAKYYIRGYSLHGGILQEWKEASGTKNFVATSELQTLILRTIPAGAIRVQLTNADGSLVGPCNVSAKKTMPEGKGEDESNSNDEKMVDIKSNQHEDKPPCAWSANSQIPFSTQDSYTVQGRCGLRYAISKDSFRIHIDNYLQNVRLVLPAPQIRTIRVVDIEGKPVPGILLDPQVSTSLFSNVYINDWRTNLNGEVKLETNPSEEEADHFKISVRPRHMRYLPTNVELKFKKGVATLILKPGKRLVGRVINSTEDKDALSKLSLSWSVSGNESMSSMNSESVSVDPEGRFEFNDVPGQSVKLSFGSSVPEGMEIHYPENSNGSFKPDDKEIQVELRSKVKKAVPKPASLQEA